MKNRKSKTENVEHLESLISTFQFSRILAEAVAESSDRD